MTLSLWGKSPETWTAHMGRYFLSCQWPRKVITKLFKNLNPQWRGQNGSCHHMRIATHLWNLEMDGHLHHEAEPSQGNHSRGESWKSRWQRGPVCQEEPRIWRCKWNGEWEWDMGGDQGLSVCICNRRQSKHNLGHSPHSQTPTSCKAGDPSKEDKGQSGEYFMWRVSGPVEVSPSGGFLDCPTHQSRNTTNQFIIPPTHGELPSTFQFPLSSVQMDNLITILSRKA